ncbi:MAG: hypothetical protein HC896_18235 [Bacteroidales bacterium]|nr:hypothetical protein [Bacteroidales bacterium]
MVLLADGLKQGIYKFNEGLELCKRFTGFEVACCFYPVNFSSYEAYTDFLVKGVLPSTKKDK